MSVIANRDEVLGDLLSKGVVVLDGEVGGKMVDHVYRCLAVLEGRGSPDIEVRIYTGGGSVRAGLDIYDALRRYKGKKSGVVYAYARSMGAIILQACDTRICLPHARVLIHHISTESVSLDDLEDPDRLAKLLASMRKDQEALYAILAKYTGKIVEEIRAACQKDQDMFAEEALAFGLVDQIEQFD